ncbi:MAG: sigma-70 family RNA polymerase sigma factor [Patescibacteria group bacterium]|jgi:RNA polymerase sigma-70 factor (ECF subfamily)
MNPTQTTKLQAVLATAHHDYQKGLTTHAFFKVPDRTMSDDLVQDTFMKTWSYLIKGGKIDVMKAFLYHVLNHLIVDEYRKNKTVSLDVLLEKGFEPSIDPSKRLVNFLDGKTALLLIQRLPQKYQKVMRMRYTQDLSLQEMSLITGQSKNAMAVQVHRGLKKLKQLYYPI